MTPARWVAATCREVADLFYPSLCPVCGRPLVDGETFFCTACAYALPRMPLAPLDDNPVIWQLAGQLPLDRAAAFLRYAKDSAVQVLFERFKYGDEPKLAFQLGRMAAERWAERGLFEGVDAFVPVPLHPERAASRGYNQSEWIARGLASVSAVPVETRVLQRSVRTDTQTKKNAWDRFSNMEGVFALAPGAGRPGGPVCGRHLMLVDDVLTTGATLTACGRTLLKGGAGRISLFALALAGFLQ